MGDADFLSDEWLEAQREFWANLSARDEQEEGAQAATTNPSEQALNQWWQALAPAAPPMIQELLEKTVAQGRQLFQLAERFAETQQTAAGSPDWQMAVQQTFGDLRGIIGGIAGSMHPLPEALLSEAAAGSSGDYLKRLFALPGLGSGHKSQVQQRELLARLLRYQQARQDYERFYVDLGNRAISRLQEQVAQSDGQGGRIDSARALYDLWVVSCEAVYAEQVMTPEYVRLYGELINSQMTLKQQMRSLLDDTFCTLGLPTTQDIRLLEQRAHQDRQAIKSLRHELSDLRKQMDAGSPTRPARPRKKPTSTGK